MDCSIAIGCSEGGALSLGQGWVEETQATRWINDCIVEQRARLYHNFDNT